MPPFAGSTSVEAAEPDFNAISSLPLAFEPNVGQTDPQVRYLVHAPRAVLHFTSTELVLMLAEPSVAGAGASRNDPDQASSQAAAAPRAVHMSFVGANSAIQIAGQAPLPGVVNYLLGSDPAKWRTQVPTYGEIVYQEIYPGVDLRYDGQTGQIKGTYSVAPGADPSQIRWRYQGSDRTGITNAGALQVQVDTVTVTEHAPVAWQERDGQRTTISVAYDLAADGSIGFQLGAYDQSQPLVIDPTLTYATFLGGTAGDEARGVAVDGAGNMYIAGYTASTDFPTVKPIQGNRPADDAFVTKLNANGTGVIYSTYLGGSAADRAWDMTLDGSGNVYLTGFTESTDFPTTPGAYDRTRGGTGASGVDAFVTKLRSDGSALLFSTYLGGSTCTITGTTPEWGFAIAVDSASQVYVAGLTLCSDFPTTSNAYQTSARGLEDAFVSKLTANGSALLYSTYLGGAKLEWAEAMAIGGGGQVYITGRTLSDNFPTKNAYQASKNASTDAFVAKLSTTASGASSLVYSTYLGGPGTEKSYGIDVDAAGNAFVAGMTEASGFPTTGGAFDTTFAGGGTCPDGDTAGDAYVTKLNAAGSALVYSTYLGGSGCDAARAVAINSAGNAYVVGWTDSANFPLASPIQTSRGGGEDAFVTKLNAAGSALGYSTYLGGSSHDYARSVIVDSASSAYVVGQARSNNFPTPGNGLFPNRGGGDAFIAKIGETAPPPTTLPRTWYFAEGYTGQGFDEYLTIQNPNAQAGTATITYLLEGAAPVTRSVPLPPTSRTTVQVHQPPSASNPGGYGRTAPGQGISAKVEATLGIVVERPMYFTYVGGLRGGHNVLGATAPRQSWLFAEGYTGAGFDEYLTIMNPNSTAAAVTITYFLGSGAPITKHLSVPGSRRHTVIVHETAEGVGRNQAVSARVTTTHAGGIVVERPMYFNYGGFSQGGHNVMGAAQTHTTWFFPDGDTRPGTDTYLTIMNPSGTNAQVTITYYLDGATQVETIVAPANRRSTVAVHETAEGVGRGKTPGIKVTSANGIGLVVERPIYKGVGGDNVMGAAQPKREWLFAEGWTGQGFTESLVLLNPNDTAASVTITYYLAGGSAIEKTVSVAARSRRVVDVNGTSEGVGPNQPVSARVRTTHAGGIVAERSMTFTYGGNIPGYHTVIGYAP
jgi:hypothetical protein